VLEVIAQAAVGAMGAQSSGVVEITPDGREFVLVHSVGLGEGVRGEFERFPVSLPLPTADVARTRQPVLLGNPEEWKARYPTPPRRDGKPAADGAWAVLPLRSGEQLFGVLTLSFEKSRIFSTGEREFLMALANQCAQALERARLFETEARSRAEAEEANRAKTAFLSSMSHELRTPLNAISGYIELIEYGIHGPVTPAQTAALGRIAANQRYLLALINDILNFARLEAGQIAYNIADVSVNELLAGMEGMVEPLIRARGQTYRYIPSDQAPVAEGDRDKIQQIVLNLLTNAIKFTPAGGSVGLSSEADETVRIHVTDTGRGIARDKLETIFEPFFQVDRASGDSQQGVGLGLSISRDLARGMGGDLTVCSTDGEGSKFTLTLPRSKKGARLSQRD
jgi:signal transduction histidine kinase